MLVTLPSTLPTEGLSTHQCQVSGYRRTHVSLPTTNFTVMGGVLHWPCEGLELPRFAHMCAHQHMPALFMGHTKMPQLARLEAET